VKLVLLSDLHITDGEALHGRSPTDCLRRAIAHVAAHHGDADLCLLLGDLTMHGSIAQYRVLQEELRALPMPYRLLIGNHDDRGNFLQVFGAARADELGMVQAEVAVGDHLCVLLDTHVPGTAEGRLDGGRLARLARVLEEARQPCLLFLHHPPLRTGLPAFDAIGLRERTAFAELLAAQRAKVAGVFFGHCHMAVTGSVAGVPAFGIRSTVYQGLPNLADDRFLDAPGLPPAYAVAIVEKEGLSVHHIDFGYDGPVVVSGSEEPAAATARARIQANAGNLQPGRT